MQGVGDARNDIIFANHGHGCLRIKDELGRKSTKSRAAGIANRYTTPTERRCPHAAVSVAAIAVCGPVGLCGSRRRPCAAAAGTLPLHECRLEHPLRLSSVAARCGALRVAEDPTSPSGRQHRPARRRRARAQPARRRRRRCSCWRAVPGQAASDLYVSYAGAFARINRNHDIVLVDQRGTGQLRAARLQLPRRLAGTGRLELPALRQATLACLQKFGSIACAITPAASRSRISSRCARPWAIRRSICTAPPTAPAWRSCTCAATRGATHAAILDGVTYPQQAIGPDTPLDGERALNLIVARCLAAPDCAAAYPDLRPDLDALRRRFGRETAASTLDDPSSGAAARDRIQPQRIDRRAALPVVQRAPRPRCCRR